MRHSRYRCHHTGERGEPATLCGKDAKGVSVCPACCISVLLNASVWLVPCRIFLQSGSRNPISIVPLASQAGPPSRPYEQRLDRAARIAMMRVSPPHAVAPWRQYQDRSPSGPRIRNLHSLHGRGPYTTNQWHGPTCAGRIPPNRLDATEALRMLSANVRRLR